MRIERRNVPSVRAGLLRIHRDLFLIAKKIKFFEGERSLSDFEKLVLVLEDRRFLRHGGMDLKAGLRELLKAMCGRRHGGASTIDMQFVRTATGFKEPTLRRKMYEILLSIILQFRYSKLMILRSYLGCAFFGSHLIGVDNASRKVFGKQIGQLSREEGAELAAMLVYPKPLHPEDGWRVRVRRRANYGLRRLVRFEDCFEKIPRTEYV